MASIKQLGERKFKITVSNGYGAGGKKIAKAKTIDVPKSVQKRSIEQYVHHAAEEMERLVKLGYSEEGEMTFEEFSLRWLDRQTTYAISTLNGYRKLLEQTYPHIGQITLNRLRPIAIENMLIEIRKRTHRGKPIKESTVQKHLIAVSAVLSDAKRNEIIQRNPARMIKLPPPEKTEQLIPNDAQINDLLSALSREPEHYRYYYFLAIYTGCRRGELSALKWSDFQMLDGIPTLVVSRSRGYVSNVGVVEKGTKNNKTRTIVLSKEVWSIIEGYCYTKKWQAQDLGIPMSDYLFTDETGKLLHPDTFSKRMRKIYDENGFPKEFHLHTLRHYFVSTMLHNGVDKQTVADLAGHGDTSFLERTYCHPQTLLKQKAAVMMSNLLINGNAYIDADGKERTSGVEVEINSKMM